MGAYKGLGRLAEQLPAPIFIVVIGAGLLGMSWALLLGAPSGTVVDVFVAFSGVIGALCVLLGVLTWFFRRDRLSEYGMVGIWHPKDSREFGRKLGKARSLVVIKTWFPEDQHIQSGLKEALKKCESVELYLCMPDTKILEIRAESVLGATLESTTEWIIKCLWDVVEHTPEAKPVRVGLYESWPGCPVIQTHDRLYLGFYFSGMSSPHFPWIEVKQDSDLEVQLEKQKEILWNEATEKFSSLDELRGWLTANYNDPKYRT